MPTAALTNPWKSHLRAALAAASPLDSAVADAVLDRFDDPEIFLPFMRAHAEGLLVLAAGATALPSVIRIFMHAHAGSHIVWALLTEGQDGEVPPTLAGPLSIAGLSRRFGVSRIHIKRMFDAATQEGLVSLEDGGAIRLSDQMREELRYMFGMQLAQLLMAAEAVLRPAGVMPAT